jgi:ZIP family zinc transporter
MATIFINVNPALQALLATLFTWGLTALGSAGVFLNRNINKKLLGIMLGFGAGVMIAASYWSLLAPAIELAEDMALPAWLPGAVGFLAGGVFLWVIDKILPHLHMGLPIEDSEGIKTNWQRSILLVLAILHNFLKIGRRCSLRAVLLESPYPSQMQWQPLDLIQNFRMISCLCLSI